MNLPDVIPWYWKAGAAVLLAAAIAAGVQAYGSHKYSQGHDAAVSERAARDLVAVVKRTDQNTALSIKQDAINAILTKAKNEELAPVRARIDAERVRVGTAICNGPAATAEAQSAAGSDGTDPPGRLVREDAERDIVALKLAVEEDLATGRACQVFLRENGMTP